MCRRSLVRGSYDAYRSASYMAYRIDVCSALVCFEVCNQNISKPQQSQRIMAASVVLFVSYLRSLQSLEDFPGCWFLLKQIRDFPEG